METLNATRLLCPMPVIRTQDRIKKMFSGEQLQIVCTDPGTLHDIPAWCRIHGHQVDSIAETEDNITFIVTVGDK